MKIDTEFIQKTIKDNSLNCTELEFNEYYNSLKIDTSEIDLLNPTINTFNDMYNGVKIENIANGKYYYHISIGGRVFLQNIAPYVSGLVPLNDDNINDVINNHKEKLIADYVNSEKIQLTISNFKK